MSKFATPQEEGHKQSSKILIIEINMAANIMYICNNRSLTPQVFTGDRRLDNGMNLAFMAIHTLPLVASHMAYLFWSSLYSPVLWEEYAILAGWQRMD